MNEATPIDEAIAEYCNDLRVERQLPAKQVQAIEYILRPVLLGPPMNDPTAPSWATTMKVKTVGDITRKAVDELTMALEHRVKRDGTPVAKATRRTYGLAVRAFLAWTGSDHTKRVGVPRLRKVRKDVLSETECRAVEDGAISTRDNLIIRILVETGVREAAISVLRKEDIIERDKKYFFLRVRDKTGERFPPITRELYRDLCAYRDGRGGRPLSKSEYLFLAHQRLSRHEDFQPIGKSGTYWAVRNAATRAGLAAKRSHPHLLRATAITRMCASGMNPIYISEITGVSLSVIQSNYDNTSQEVIWEAAMRAMGR